MAGYCLSSRSQINKPSARERCRFGQHADEIIRNDSEAYEALHRRIDETFPNRDTGREGFRAWKNACDAFHSFESPIFDLITPDGLAELSSGDPTLVDWAVAYLEVDPFHFRSGYYKSWIIRRLKRAPLARDHKERLRAVVLRALDDPHRAPSYYLRLAASLQSSEFFEFIRWRLDSPYPEIRKRAQQLLAYIDAFNRSNRSTT
ncbi:hypothetical protein ACXR0O_23525 [Verrucomicrobiota bacterium sgz303538]